MPRADPHEGKYPAPAIKAAEPGSIQHRIWSWIQARKRDRTVRRFNKRSAAIGRPTFWR